MIVRLRVSLRVSAIVKQADSVGIGIFTVIRCCGEWIY